MELQWRKWTLFSILTLALFLPTSLARAADDVLTLRIGHPMAPGNSVTLGYEKFQELVQEKSGGKIRILIYGNNQLGSDHAAIESAQAGLLDMASSSTPNLAAFSSAYMVFDLPYFIDPKHQEKLYQALDQGPLGEYLDGVAQQLGFKPLMYSEYGYRNFVSVNKPLKNMRDLSGLVVRITDSPVEEAVANALGMTPKRVVWGESYTALLRGLVNCEGNTFSLLKDARHTDILHYAMDSRHNYSMHVLFMNKKKWDSLTPNQQEIIGSAAKEALAWQRAESGRLEKEATQALLDQGIVITHLTDEQRTELKQKIFPVRERFAREIPNALLELVVATQKE